MTCVVDLLFIVQEDRCRYSRINNLQKNREDAERGCYVLGSHRHNSLCGLLHLLFLHNFYRSFYFIVTKVAIHASIANAYLYKLHLAFRKQYAN